MGRIPRPDKGYVYTAYGLNIVSCIPCPELSLGRGRPDVKIFYAAVPDSLVSAKLKNDWYQSTPEQILLSIDGVGRYLVTDGKEILIDRAPDAGDDEVRLFLLGSAFGALLHQRGLLPLHGSAIEADGGCVAILGDSGLGKSALAGAFRKRGYRVMTDDICVVRIDRGNKPIILPGYPQLKLWADAAMKLGEEPELLPRIYPNEEKRGLLFQEAFCRKPMPLHHLYVIATNNSREFELTTLKGMEKLTEIINNTYRFQFLEGLSRRVPHFKQCIEVAKHAAVSRVTRPREPFLLDELAEFLEEDFSYRKLR
jgi:hypothetical protein